MAEGHIRQRSQGSWEIKYDIGRDPITGRRITKQRTIRGAKRDAQRALREALGAVDAGMHVDPGKVTLGEYLTTWLESRKHSISPRTAERYGELANKHVIPRIGALQLRKLTTASLNQLYVDLLDKGRLDGKGGLAPQTVRHVDRLLHKALRDAVKQRLLATNVSDEAERPKVPRKPKRTLSDDELQKLITAASGTALYAPLFTILSTGIRRGELLALRWRNVDLTAGVLFAIETVEETKAGLRLKDVKTAAGRRRIDLPSSTVDVLRAHQVEQKKLALALGIGWSVDDLLFPGREGGLQRPRNFTKAVTSFAARHGVAGFGPHAGRHDHFTRLLRGGVHPKVAQMRAGHASIQVTLDVYSHAVEGLQREAVERIEHTFRALRDK